MVVGSVRLSLGPVATASGSDKMTHLCKAYRAAVAALSEIISYYETHSGELLVFR
jgi:hypothetical protein